MPEILSNKFIPGAQVKIKRMPGGGVPINLKNRKGCILAINLNTGIILVDFGGTDQWFFIRAHLKLYKTT